MAEVKNNILQNAGAKGGAYIVPGDGALDARFVVTTYATLLNEAGWQLTLSGETVKTLPYVGLTTYAQDTQKLYVCTKVGTTDIFNGIEWKEVGSDVDLSNYYTKDEVGSLIPDVPVQKIVYGDEDLDPNEFGTVIIPAPDLSDYAKKADISSVYKFKGNTVALPTECSIGDVYNSTQEITIGEVTYPAGTNFAWTGSDWDALTGIQDLSSYDNKIEIIKVKSSDTVTTSLPIDSNDKSVTIDLSGINARLIPDTTGVTAPAILTFNDGEVAWSSSELQTELPEYDSSNNGNILQVNSEGELIWAPAPNNTTITNTTEETVVVSSIISNGSEEVEVYSKEGVNKLLSWESL